MLLSKNYTNFETNFKGRGMTMMDREHLYQLLEIVHVLC